MKRRIFSGALLLCLLASLLILPANAVEVMHCRVYNATISGVPSGESAITEENSTLEKAFGNDAQYICTVNLERGKTYFLTTGSRESDESQNASPMTAFSVWDLGSRLDVTYGFGYCLTAGDSTYIEITNEDPSIYQLYEVTELIQYTDYRTSSCQSDLEYFGFTEYPTEEEQNTGNTSFIHVAHCFESYYASSSIYGVYFYIYNPSGVNILDGSIKLATSFSADGSPAKYESFALTSCGSSERGIYKLRLTTPSKLRSFLSASSRVYAYSGITLRYAGDKTVTYDNTGKFTFTGSDFDSSATVLSLTDGVAANALAKAFTSGTDDYTVKLDIGYTYYRTDTSYQGANHHNQIDSIYFSMPTYLETRYGELSDVELSYWKARTQPIFVFDDKSLYDSMYWNVGKACVFDPGRDPRVPLVWTGSKFPSTLNGKVPGGYNIPLKYRALSFNEISTCHYVFLVEDCDAGVRDPKSTVPGDQILSWIRSYEPAVLPALKTTMPDGKMYYAELFESYDSAMTTLHTSDLNLIASSYKDDHNFFEEWAEYGLLYAMFGTSTDQTITLTPEDMIQTIGSRSAIENGSDTYYFAESDKSNLSALYDPTGKNTLKIVHFNISDYYQEDAYASFSDLSDLNGFTEDQIKNAYLAQEDLYFDLHVLSLGLKDTYGTVTRVNAESNHIDAAADLTDEKDPGDINDQAGAEAGASFKSWWEQFWNTFLTVLKVIGFVFLAVVLVWLISKLVSLIQEWIRRYKSKQTEPKSKNKPKNKNRKE